MEEASTVLSVPASHDEREEVDREFSGKSHLVDGVNGAGAESTPLDPQMKWAEYAPGQLSEMTAARPSDPSLDADPD